MVVVVEDAGGVVDGGLVDDDGDNNGFVRALLYIPSYSIDFYGESIPINPATPMMSPR